MKRYTRERFTELREVLERNYNVNDLSHTFDVEVPTERRILEKVQESNAFLQEITMTTVTDTQGQALELGVSGLLAKRTDVSAGPRQPYSLGDMEGTDWEVAFTEMDVAMGYKLLDAWARYPNFFNMYMQQVYKIIGLNRLMIGWLGSKAAKKTDPKANPNGEDVNYGWLARLKEHNPDHFLGSEASEVITLGKGGDYPNLDTLVFDLYELIPEAHRTGDEVAIMGRELLAHDANKNLTLNADDPRRKEGVNKMTASYAGLPTMTAAHFPARGIVITDPKNLHLYSQEGTSRRQQKEEPEYNRVVEYISTNDAYTIGDLKAISGINGSSVKFADAADNGEAS